MAETIYSPNHIHYIEMTERKWKLAKLVVLKLLNLENTNKQSNNNNNNNNIKDNHDEALKLGKLSLAKSKSVKLSGERQRGDQFSVFQPFGQPKQALIDGEIWPPSFLPEHVRSAKAYVPVKTDVFVCTYPKCGTTWTQHICSQLMFDNYQPGVGKELFCISPMIERNGAPYVRNLSMPRLIKTHFQWKHLPKNPQSKYIFVCRNPKDCLVSYYFHHRNFKIYNFNNKFDNGDFDAFFELFIGGKLGFGDYFEHLLGWLPHIREGNVLFLCYETMLDDCRAAIEKVAGFLGGKFDGHFLDRVVRESGLEAMAKDQWRWFPQENLNEIGEQKSFIRKGRKKDWLNYLSREQSDRMDALFREKMRGTEAENWWRYEMQWE